VSRPHGTVDDHRVVLYTRAGCHLCEEARVVVAEVCAAAGEAWVEVDIEVGASVPAGDGGTDRGPAGVPGAGASDLVAKFGDYVPVVEVDGVQQGFWHIDAARLARRLAR
jgi:hypothetical protein